MLPPKVSIATAVAGSSVATTGSANFTVSVAAKAGRYV